MALQYTREFNIVHTGRTTAEALRFNSMDFTQNGSFFRKHEKTDYDAFVSQCREVAAEVEIP